MPRRTRLTDFQPMQDEVLKLREENSLLRQRIDRVLAELPRWDGQSKPLAEKVRELLDGDGGE